MLLILMKPLGNSFHNDIRTILMRLNLCSYSFHTIKIKTIKLMK